MGNLEPRKKNNSTQYATPSLARLPRKVACTTSSSKSQTRKSGGKSWPFPQPPLPVWHPPPDIWHQLSSHVKAGTQRVNPPDGGFTRRGGDRAPRRHHRPFRLSRPRLHNQLHSSHSFCVICALARQSVLSGRNGHLTASNKRHSRGGRCAIAQPPGGEVTEGAKPGPLDR